MGRIEPAYGQLIQQVEKFTRFDRNSLALESSLERTVRGRATWRYTPSFPIVRSQHSGMLPAGAVKAENAPEMEKLSAGALAAARSALPARLNQWMAAQAASDVPLTAAVCLARTQTFGYQFSCPPCRGHGEVTCPVCSGGRLLDCSSCNGGWRVCGDCGGSCEMDCPACNGRGKLASGASCRKRVPCPGCLGRGKTCCGVCGGSAKVLCRRCNPWGMVTCDPCAGTKWQHVAEVLSCNVRDSFFVDVKDDNKEIVSTLSRRDLTKLRRIATAKQVAPHIDRHDVVREYDVACDVAELRVKAGKTVLPITGFGAQSEIFDYHGIIDVLLESDLSELEQVVKKTRFRLWRPSRPLREATKTCLDSEANVQIGDAGEVESRHAVTPKYKQRFLDALNASLARLFVAEVGLVAIAVVLLPVTLLVAAHVTVVRAAVGRWVYPAALAIAALGWVVGEWVARRRITKAAGTAAQMRLAMILRRHPVRTNVRGWTAVLAIALLVAGAFVVREPVTRVAGQPVATAGILDVAAITDTAMPPEATPPAPVEDMPGLESYSGVACIENTTEAAIPYAFRWDGGPWQERTIGSGSTEPLSAKLGSRLQVRFDGNVTDTAWWVSRELDTNSVSEPDTCEGAKKYTFIQTRELIGVLPVEWTPGWQHPFMPNVIAGGAKDDWWPAPGYRWYDKYALIVFPEDLGFVGITAGRDERRSYPHVVKTLSEGPAERAGIRRGMEIISVDDVSTSGMSVTECHALLTGTPGTSVRVGIREPFSSFESSFLLVRR